MHSNCRLLPFVQYCSSINILVTYRKRSSEETDAGTCTSSTSEDFDKPPWEKVTVSVRLIIYLDVSPFLIWKDIVSLHFQKLLEALPWYLFYKLWLLDGVSAHA